MDRDDFGGLATSFSGSEGFGVFFVGTDAYWTELGPHILERLDALVPRAMGIFLKVRGRVGLGF